MQSRIRSRNWLWLLLALWLISQSWAWMHRVEHAAAWRSTAAHTEVAPMVAGGEDLHAGLSCEWLDHSLLGGAAPTASHCLPAAVAAAGGLPTFPPCNAQVADAQPYLARAPPGASGAFEGRWAG